MALRSSQSIGLPRRGHRDGRPTNRLFSSCRHGYRLRADHVLFAGGYREPGSLRHAGLYGRSTPSGLPAKHLGWKNRSNPLPLRLVLVAREHYHLPQYVSERAALPASEVCPPLTLTEIKALKEQLILHGSH